MVAEVIINSTAKELNKIFDYIVPKDLENTLEIGSRVFVPFGRNKIEEGYTINIKQDSEYANKEIIKIEDSILTKDNVELAKLMARRYFCNVSDTIKLMLPPGDSNKKIEDRIKDKTGNFVELNIGQDEFSRKVTDKQRRVLDFLKQNGRTYISDLIDITDTSKAIINTLEKNKHIKIIEEKISRNPFIHKQIKRDKPYILNEEQQNAYNRIVNVGAEFLIYGITGSRQN